MVATDGEDVDAAGKPFGWFLEGFDKRTEWLVFYRRVLMNTEAVSRMVGEDAMGGYAVRPGWRAEIEAKLDGAEAVDWDAYDYFIGASQLSVLDATDAAGAQRYPWFAPP